MIPGPVSAPRGAARSPHPTPRASRLQRLAAASALVLAGCVTTYEEAPLFGIPDPGAPVLTNLVIPFGAPAGNREMADLYHGVLQRMREALDARDPDLPLLESLLDRYQRSDLSEELQQTLHSYRLQALGLRATAQLRERAALRRVALPDEVLVTLPDPAATVPPIGGALQYAMHVPAGASPIRLGGAGDDPVAFAISIRVEDQFVDGGTRSTASQELVVLPHAVELRGQQALDLPLSIHVAGGDAVRRAVRIDVDLLPGYVTFGEQRVPVRRTPLVRQTVTQYPLGYDAVAKAPLAEFRAAMRSFGPKDHARAYLAALAAPPADHAEIQAALIDQVRLGDASQARVAMAALHAMTAGAMPIGDRDGWLAWWQRRR